jgi:hypothetical protein
LNGKPFAKKRLMRQLMEMKCRSVPNDKHLTQTVRMPVSPEWAADHAAASDEEENDPHTPG